MMAPVGLDMPDASGSPSLSTATPSPSADEVLRALDRLLASATLRGSERLRRFLKLVVEETLAGRGDRLKEYVIGVEVLERPDTYDPKADPVVRVEARRLRGKLADYYQSEGKADEVRIELPKGAYVASFVRREPPASQPGEEGPTGSDAGRPVPTASTSPVATSGISAPPTSSARRWTRPVFIVASLVVLATVVGTGALIWRLWPGRPIPAVAVLPFENASKDSENDYFCFGLVEDLTTALAQSQELRVISRTSSAAFKGGQDVRDIGQRLHADYVVEGSVRKAGTELRITAQLISTSTGEHVWANAWNRNERDPLGVQTEIASAIASALGPKVARGMPTGPRHSIDPEAHVQYVKGQYFMGTIGQQAPERAVEYLRRAIELAPDYAAAHAALAAAYAKITLDRPAPVAAEIDLAKAEAHRAIELDPQNADAQALLAWVAFFYDWNWPEAERGFKGALALNPSSAVARHRYALLLVATGRFDEALDMSAQAVALDPLSALVASNRTMILLCARRYKEAIAQGQIALELAPGAFATHVLIGSSQAQLGRFADAIASYRAALRLAPDDGDAACSLARAQSLSGSRDEALRLLGDLVRPDRPQPPSQYEIAYLYAALGQTGKAFEALENARARRETELVYLDVDPLFDGLRQDPRFKAFVGSLGLRK
jgi:TolB-like protein/Tfp pilus assembly protein PilF